MSDQKILIVSTRFFSLLTLTIILASVSCESASKKANTMKGPKAKNQKPWMKEKDSSRCNIMVEKKELSSPQIKNQRPGKLDKTVQVKLGELKSIERLKGPKAKNKKK